MWKIHILFRTLTLGIFLFPTLSRGEDVLAHVTAKAAYQAKKQFLEIEKKITTLNPSAPQQEKLNGRYNGVYYQIQRTPGRQLTHVFYHNSYYKTTDLLAIISVKQTPQGNKINVVSLDNNKVNRNTISVETVLSYRWQEIQSENVHKEKVSVFDEAVLKTGDETLDMLLFLWRAYHNLEAIRDAFDTILDEAYQTLNSIDVRTDVDEHFYHYMENLIAITEEAREKEIISANKKLAFWILVDAATFLPDATLKPLFKGIVASSKYIAKTRVGEKVAVIAGRASRATTTKFRNVVDELIMSKIFAQASFETAKANMTALMKKPEFMKAKAIIGRGVTRLGLASSLKRVKAGTEFLRKVTLAGGMRARLINSMHSYPGIQKLVETIIPKAFTEETRRMYITNLTYGLIYTSSIQTLVRGYSIYDNYSRNGDLDSDYVLEQLNGFLVDMFNTTTFLSVIGRYTVVLDTRHQLTAYQNWHRRQGFYLGMNTWDLGVNYTRLLYSNDWNDLSDEQIDFLKRRALALFSYSIVRATPVSTASSAVKANWNNAIIEARSRGQFRTALQLNMAEFLSIFVTNNISGYMFLNYRDGYTSNIEISTAEAINELNSIAEQFRAGKKMKDVQSSLHYTLE